MFVVSLRFKSVLAFALVIFASLSVGCSNYSLQIDQPVQAFKTDGELCLASPETRTRVNKILFVVDKSGSNVQAGGVVGAGNDPEDVRRADNIQNFLNENGQQPFQEYGYIAFGVDSTEAHAYINNGNLFEPRFGDAQDLQEAIDTHRSVPDDGCTPYLAAIRLSKTAIELDMENNPDQEAVYNIVFMSDGFPNDAIPEEECVTQTPVENSPTDPYIRGVRDLVELSPNRIFFSTAYYTLPENDPARVAADGLRYMSETGGGRFVDLQGNDEIDFNDVRVGPTPESWVMKKMMVYNLNSAFCLDGSIGADSDSDGLCDNDEISLNQQFASRLPAGRSFNPTQRNSINDDYSDLFSFRFDVLPTGEGLPTCNLNEPDQDFDFLNSCEENALYDVQANGPTDQWTLSLRNNGGGVAATDNPDSDGDGYLDSFEYFQFGVKSSAVNYTNIFNRYPAGITGDTLMAEYRHPKHPDSPADTNTDFRVTFSRINTKGENCYNVDLNGLAMFDVQKVELSQVSGDASLVHEANENILYVYYIAVRENDPNGKGYLMHKTHKVKAFGFDAQEFLFSNYDSYKVPEVQ